MRSPEEPVGARRIILVRHASTEWSRSGQHTGRTDIPLDEDGRAGAVELGARLSAERVERVVSSPLSRALDTCRLAGFGDRVELDENLLEWDYGDYEGLTTDEIRRSRAGWNLFFDGCPHGEDAATVGRRADRAIESLLAVPDALTTVVFAHGHILRVLGARWLGLAPEEGRRFSLGTATLSELGFEREERAMLHWNL